MHTNILLAKYIMRRTFSYIINEAIGLIHMYCGQSAKPTNGLSPWASYMNQRPVLFLFSKEKAKSTHKDQKTRV